MTKIEAIDWISAHADDDVLDDEELLSAFTALYERVPDADDWIVGLWSLLCAGMPWAEEPDPVPAAGDVPW